MKKCIGHKCENVVPDNRKKYCSDRCKRWTNLIKRDNEKYLPPVRKRNNNYFHMVTGATSSSMRGQGKRVGGMITGGMSARVLIQTEEITLVNHENLHRHFNGNSFGLTVAKLCGGAVITREQFMKGQYQQYLKPTHA